MGITKIHFELMSGFYQDYKKRKPGFYRDYEKPRKKAMGFYKDSKKSTKKLFGDSDIFFRDSSGFFGILRDSVIFLVISAALVRGTPSFWPKKRLKSAKRGKRTK